MAGIATDHSPESPPRDTLRALADGLAQLTADVRGLAEDTSRTAASTRASLAEIMAEVSALSATVGAQEVNVGQLSRAHQATLALLAEVHDAVRSLSRDIARLGRRIDVHAADPAAHSA